jgi:hypothetical protein
MGVIIFWGHWLPSIKKPWGVSPQFLSQALPDRADLITRPRPGFLGSFFLTLFIVLLTLGLAIPSFSADLSDRVEDGLLGDVLSIETRESLLVQTDRYDPVGRLIERVQIGVETSQGLWPLRFVYTYDQAGRRTAEVVQDARGAVVKETRSVYDDRGNRSAELAAWGDGTFENVSLYEYDDEHRRAQAGPSLQWRAGDQSKSLCLRCLRDGWCVSGSNVTIGMTRAGHRVVMTDRFDTGYDVAILYDERGHVRRKNRVRSPRAALGRSEFQYDERGTQIEERIVMMPTDGSPTEKSTATNTMPSETGLRKRCSGGR